MKKSSFAIIVIGAMSFLACNKPIASFLVNDDEKRAPAEITFENTSKNAETYIWDFGDGKTSSDQNPNHRYLKSGSYIVKLTASKEGKESAKTQEISIKSPNKCLVEIQTDYGNMLVELYDDTPAHQDNFTKLAEEGYFDGLIFHRIIAGFMIQGGDPDSRDAKAGQPLGAGGPGYTIPAEFKDSLYHVPGALAAARQGDQVNPKKESSGSQFYIVQGSPVPQANLEAIESRMGKRYPDEIREIYLEEGGTPFLDGQYTVFGQVISGMEVLEKIASVKTDQRDRPTEDVKMKVIVIR